jgi:hypothetical protein
LALSSALDAPGILGLTSTGVWLLFAAAGDARLNPHTGRQHVGHSFFSTSHLEHDMNFVCSMKSVDILPSAIFIIATDETARHLLRSLWLNVIFTGHFEKIRLH